MVVDRRDILESDADYIVIPVNRLGVAGAGLAKQWADMYPELHYEYRNWCNLLAMGSTSQQICLGGRFIMFPTKNHWKDKSNLLNIRTQLAYMYWYMIPHYKRKTVAIPLVGAGLGGLDPKEVLDLLSVSALGANALLGIETDIFT